MTAARPRQAKSLAAEAAFHSRVLQLGGRVLGEYVNVDTTVECICAAGHTCWVRPSGLQQGRGMCRTCARKDPAAAKAAFHARIAELGGQVIGTYKGVLVPVDCLCPAGHACRPRPADTQRGIGICRACAKCDPAAAEAAFRARIAELGGQIVGEYVNTGVGVDCICPAGHACKPVPDGVKQGQGMCLACVGRDPAQAEAAFRARIDEVGGLVVGEYVNVDTPVDCLCPAGHRCRPRPAGVRNGQGICRVCVRRDPVAAEEAFYARIAELGAQVVGKYVNVKTPIDCICPAGHTCSPRPGAVQQGQGLCLTCKGLDWDILYVVTNPTLGRVKFGITSGDERVRLAEHRRSGYTDVVRVHRDLPDAAVLERHVLATLRDADIPPVRGREHYDLSALPVVLDVVEGWVTT